MTYAKDWRSYPPMFVNLIEQASLRTVEIPCADEKDAKRLEGKLHAFFGALHRNALKDKELVPLDNSSRRVRVKAQGSILFAGPRDTEPDNQLIAQALGLSPATNNAGEVPMSAELRELMAQSLTSGE